LHKRMAWEIDRYRGIVDVLHGHYTPDYFFHSGQNIIPTQVNFRSSDYLAAITRIRHLSGSEKDATIFNMIAADHLRGEINTVAYYWRIFEAFYPVVHSLLTRCKPDVIIGCNDDMALLLHKMLGMVEFKKCKPIEIIGFDDTDIALFNGFSSYNFNNKAFISAALQFVLHPEPIRFQKSDTLHISGYVTVRNY